MGGKLIRWHQKQSSIFFIFLPIFHLMVGAVTLHSWISESVIIEKHEEIPKQWLSLRSRSFMDVLSNSRDLSSSWPILRSAVPYQANWNLNTFLEITTSLRSSPLPSFHSQISTYAIPWIYQSQGHISTWSLITPRWPWASWGGRHVSKRTRWEWISTSQLFLFSMSRWNTIHQMICQIGEKTDV